MSDKQYLVLVVDDSYTIKKMIDMTLTKNGYKTITADNGFYALALAYENKPDLIILDVSMPKMNGYETCRVLKKHPVFHNVPVLMLSAKDSLDDKMVGKDVGVDEYLTKPFVPQELLDTVAKMVQVHG